MTLLVGLSGGIGSGKSTVSAQLASLGAVVVDADAVAREVVAPGTPSLAQIRERFGPGVIAEDGTLDRPALGREVFGDEDARRDLEGITHPHIRRRSAELIAAAPQDAVVVHDIPLLVELGLAADYALTVLVDVPETERLRRLVELRGMDEAAARARIRAQAGDAERAAAADVLLDNSTSPQDLHGRVGELWSHRLLPFRDNLQAGRPSHPAPVGPTTQVSDPVLARLLARVEAGVGEPVAPDTTAPTSEPLDLAGTMSDLHQLDVPRVRQRLARRGLLVLADENVTDVGRDTHAAGSTGRVIASADPALPVRLHLHGRETG